MLRLLAIAVVAVLSFFPIFLGITWMTAGSKLAFAVAATIAFVGVPTLALVFWRTPPAGAKCPEGKGLYPECLFIANVDETHLSVQRPEGRIDRMAFAAMREIAIVTNDSGPIGSDVWWVASGAGEPAELAFPAGATGESTVLARLQALPGFDNEAVIAAMGSADQARFVCWRRTEPAGT
jgi:hypothetical protein